MKALALIGSGAALILLGLAGPGAQHQAGPTPHLASATLIAPVTGAVLTQTFGCTAFELEPLDPACPGGHFHSGLDLAGPPAGTPVVAAATGIATVIDSPNGYGLHVVLDHGGGVTTLYGHLESVAVVTGAVVGRGERLGKLGSSGNSTGPHLHFEVRRDGRPVDPTAWISGHDPLFNGGLTTWSTR